MNSSRVIAIPLILVLAVGSTFVACNKEKKEVPVTRSTPAASQLSIDDLVAPIALYPDQLLAQVLSAATNPQEVLDLGNWLLQNQSLQPKAAPDAAKQAGFSVSAQYLAAFPQVVDNMCQEMDWTKQLGEAFKSDQQSVMQAVQRKRDEAQKAGNLNSGPQMTVANKQADNGQQYVEIKPTNPDVVYVPQYNPTAVYTTPAPTTTTTTEEKSGVSTGAAVAIGLLSFGVGMAVGNAISNNNDYYPYPAWGYHSVYVVNRPYYPPPYRPPVYAGYRPAYGYNPPATYHWNQYNRNVNVNVNNNYYNQFHNTNLGSTATNRPENYRGQNTYQGARTTNTVGQKPGASMANAYQPNRQPQMASRNSAIENRGGNQQLARSNSNNLSGATINRPSQQPANFNRGGDRGYGTAGNNTQLASNSNTLAQNRGASSPSPAAQNRAGSDDRGGAFGNSGGLNAKSDRAASTRGRSSMSAGGGGRQRH